MLMMLSKHQESDVVNNYGTIIIYTLYLYIYNYYIIFEIKSLLEKGAIESTTPSSIYFTDVLCPKKRWINEASVQSERTESVPTLGTFQNGKRSDDQRSHPRRRLDGKNGSEEYLLCPANQARGSEVVEDPMGKGDFT